MKVGNYFSQISNEYSISLPDSSAYVKFKEQQRPTQISQERAEIVAIEKIVLTLELRKQSITPNRLSARG